MFSQLPFKTLCSQKPRNFFMIMTKRTKNIYVRGLEKKYEYLPALEANNLNVVLGEQIADPLMRFLENLKQVSIFIEQPHEFPIWRKNRQMEKLRYLQRFIPERHKTLGNDLASAHFLLHRGGKVKFVGHSEWMGTENEEGYVLPETFDPNYVIEAIDLSNINILYEGLENFRGLTRLKWAKFKGCPYFDDWCMDRISAQFPRMEYLDVSDCKNVSEKGLEALYKSRKLKTLIATNHNRTKTFDLTCLMLEDYIPELECKIEVPEITSKPEEKQIAG